MNEKQRLRNRRVEIIFERGQPTRPPPVFFDIIEATNRAIRSMPQPPLPLPRPDNRRTMGAARRGGTAST